MQAQPGLGVVQVFIHQRGDGRRRDPARGELRALLLAARHGALLLAAARAPVLCGALAVAAGALQLGLQALVLVVERAVPVVGARGLLLQPLPQLGGGDAGLLGGGQLLARLGEFVAAARQLLGGAVAGQGVLGVADLALGGHEGVQHRRQLRVDAGQLALGGGAAGLHGAGAELVLVRLHPHGARAAPVVHVGLGRDPGAAQLLALARVGHAAQVLQLLHQPARHGGGELHVRKQRAALALERHGARLDDVVAVALALAQLPGVGQVRGLVQQRHPAVAAQHALDGGAPALVLHLHHLGHEAVADAAGRERLAKARHLGRQRRQVLAFQRRQGGGRHLALLGELAALVLQGGFLLLQPGQMSLQLIGVAALVHQGQQLLLAFGQLLQRRLVARGLVQLLARLVALHAQLGGQLLGLAALIEQVQEPLVLHRLLGQGGAVLRLVAAQLTRVAGQRLALAMPGQHGQHLGGQALALGQLELPGLVAGNAVVQLGQLGAAVVHLALGLSHLARQQLLVLARLVVGVQHLLVAEHVEHQAQQLARAEFAQPVGLALLQRQHARNRRRQPGGRQHAAPGLHAHEAQVFFGHVQHLLDGDVALHQAVAALPVAAIAVDAAGQRDLVAVEQAPRERAAGALPPLRPVVHHGAQPGGLRAGVAGIGAVVARGGAAQAQQRAHGVQQRGLARAVGPGDGDDGAVQRQADALAVVPVDEFKGLQVEHASQSSCAAFASVLIAACA